MITAVYVAVNEGRNIAESMRSVKAYVDRFVIVDSVFESNPDPHTHSTDDQMQEAIRISDSLTYIQSDIRMSETDARNLALSHVEPGSWALIIDGDECLYGDHDAVDYLVTIIDSGMYKAIAIPVFTTAILFDGNAPEMSRSEHAANPLISTMAMMVRFVRVDEGLRYVLPSGHITPMLVDPAGDVVVGFESDAALLINRHATQPYDVYQSDFVWEMGARAP